MASVGRGDDIPLRQYLQVLRKRWGVIAGFLVLVVGVIGARTYVEQPIYRAVARVIIERETQIVNFQQTPSFDWDSGEFFNSQVQIIRSRPVLQRVIDSLNLKERKPDYGRVPDPTGVLQGAIAVEPLRNTRLVQIGVEDPDPQLAAEMANALATSYQTQNLELKLAAARDALTWLSNQVRDLKSKVNESELALQQYREQAGLVSLEEKQNLTVKKLAEFNSTYIEAKAKRLEMETRLAELRRAAQKPELLESSPMVVNNPLIQKLKGQLVELEVQRSKLLKVYKEKHPEVVKVQTQIDEVGRRMKEEVDKLALSMESEYNVTKAREAAMLQAVDQYRAEAQNLSKKEIQYGILKREADSNQQLYEVLLKKLKETSLIQGLDTNNVRIVEPAVAPRAPVRPQKVRNLAVAVVLGLALGVGTAFVLEHLDDRIRTPEQAERALDIPVLAVIPVFAARARS
ncbi:MAG TPA: GumC family protein [Methylomirabilota bacterium]|nr:GumC family protein [Methylomirabilota bacterium]